MIHDGLEPLVDILLTRTSIKERVGAFMERQLSPEGTPAKMLPPTKRNTQLLLYDEQESSYLREAGTDKSKTTAAVGYGDFAEKETAVAAWILTRKWVNGGLYMARDTETGEVELDARLSPIDKNVKKGTSIVWSKRALNALATNFSLTADDAHAVLEEAYGPLKEYLRSKEHHVTNGVSLTLDGEKMMLRYIRD